MSVSQLNQKEDMKRAAQQEYSVGKVCDRIVAVSRAREANLGGRVETLVATGSVSAVSVRHLNRGCKRCMGTTRLIFLLLPQSINQSRYLQAKTSVCQLVNYNCTYDTVATGRVCPHLVIGVHAKW